MAGRLKSWRVEEGVLIFIYLEVTKIIFLLLTPIYCRSKCLLGVFVSVLFSYDKFTFSLFPSLKLKKIEEKYISSQSHY